MRMVAAIASTTAISTGSTCTRQQIHGDAGQAHQPAHQRQVARRVAELFRGETDPSRHRQPGEEADGDEEEFELGAHRGAQALPATPADSKLAISLRKFTAACTSGYTSARAGAFAQAQVELHQRFGAQVGQLHHVAGLVGAVGEHAVVEDLRRDGVGHQQRAGDDEAVDQQHHLRFG